MSALNNTSHAKRTNSHTLQKSSVCYRNNTLVCDAIVAETSRTRGLFPFRSPNLDSFEVYKYCYLFPLKFQENVEQRGADVTFGRYVVHHPVHVLILYLHTVSVVNS